jgi:predicted alpha/beta superfamily hydrolase
VFTKGGIFSPSYWFSPDVFSYTTAARLPRRPGSSSGWAARKAGNGAQPAQDAHALTADRLPPASVNSKVIPEGKHHESFWRNEFPEAVLWLFE